MSQQVVQLDGQIVVSLPDGCGMTGAEKNIMERRIAAFAQWELNEFVRYKTGIVNYYGPSMMEENHNAYKKES